MTVAARRSRSRRERVRPAASFRTSVALCAVLAVALRAPFRGTPLGVDEGGLAFVAEHWARRGSSLYGAQWLDRPPLLVLLVRVAVAAGGQTGVRVLGALAAVALVALAALLARAIAGARAGTGAAVVCAVLASSIALQAVYTPAELLAAVPASASVLCLVAALRSGRLAALVAAGALAVAAALVKQSFLDAGLAGMVFLLACVMCRPPPFRPAWVAAWGAGAALPLAAVVLASGLGFVDGGELPYALIGFRVAALHTLGGAGVPLTTRAMRLAVPALPLRARARTPARARGPSARGSRAGHRGHPRRLARRRPGGRRRGRRLLGPLPDRDRAGDRGPGRDRAGARAVAGAGRDRLRRGRARGGRVLRGRRLPRRPSPPRGGARGRPLHPRSRAPRRHPVRPLRARECPLLRRAPHAVPVRLEPDDARADGRPPGAVPPPGLPAAPDVARAVAERRRVAAGPGRGRRHAAQARLPAGRDGRRPRDPAPRGRGATRRRGAARCRAGDRRRGPAQRVVYGPNDSAW